jgi:hypothetical protein
MAALRNLAITILRLTGATSIAAALRHHARRQPGPSRRDRAPVAGRARSASRNAGQPTRPLAHGMREQNLASPCLSDARRRVILAVSHSAHSPCRRHPRRGSFKRAAGRESI